MDTAYGAVRRAALYLPILALEICHTVLLQRNARIPALLRAPVDQSVFTHIQIPGARAAVPFVRPAVRQVLLKPVVGGEIERRSAQLDQTIQNAALGVVERAKFTASVVDDACGRRKPQRAGTSGNRHCVIRLTISATDN